MYRVGIVVAQLLNDLLDALMVVCGEGLANYAFESSIGVVSGTFGLAGEKHCADDGKTRGNMDGAYSKAPALRLS
jgi:hypothetical protein